MCNERFVENIIKISKFITLPHTAALIRCKIFHTKPQTVKYRRTDAGKDGVGGDS